MRTPRLSLLVTLCSLGTASAEPVPELAAIDVEPPIARPSHRFAVELDVVQPFFPTVNILKPKFSWTVWGTPGGLRGDLLGVLYVRPHIVHDVVETMDEYMLGVGYRQYFWRGLHLEVLLEGGVAWGTNRFDHRAYTTPTLFLEVNGGYRFGFFEPGGFFFTGTEKVGFFVAPQLGTIIGLGVADIGPRNGKPDWFLQGNLLLGLSF